MPDERMIKLRQVGWNGIRLTVPGTWEVHLGGDNHLIFEEDFAPVLEIRWQKVRKRRGNQSLSILKRIKKTVTALHELTLPSEWSFLKDRYDVTCYGESDHLPFNTGVCICKQCQSLLLFQLSNRKKRTEPPLIKCMKSLSCQCAPDETNFWALQDFQLQLPSGYSLIDYSFAPGLTRISFRGPHCILHTCKLGPADARLAIQPLDEILRSLADVPDLPVQFGDDGKFCKGYRAPAIGRQLTLRFKRKKPFIRAEISHIITSNRLLAIVLESLRPIPVETSQSICSNYEIIQI